MRARPAFPQRRALQGGTVVALLLAVLLATATQASGSSAVGANTAATSDGGGASSGPNIICCGYVTISNVMTQVSSSNLNSNNTVTITFSTSPSGTTNAIYWGLNTSYSGYESGEVNLGTSARAVLPYLNPGTTFYFSISAEYSQPGVEWYPGESGGSFSTGAVPHPQSGTVYTNSSSWQGSGPVYGYVLGQAGVHTVGASIRANYTSQDGNCGTTTQLTINVASNDSYVIPAWVSSNYFATFCTLESWQASGPGYMTESWFPPTFSESGSANWQAFYLTSQFITSQSQQNLNGGQDGVYNAIAYVHTTNAACQIEQGVYVSTSVYAYLAGSGFTDTKTLETQTIFPTGFTAWGDSIGMAYEYKEDGYYSINPNGGISGPNFYAVGGAYGPYNELYTGTDPVAAPPSVGATSTGYASPYGVPAGQQGGYQMYSSGTMQSQVGLQASIGVSVGIMVSVSYSVDLSYGLQSTQTGYTQVLCHLDATNSSSYQYFEIYAQTGLNGGTSAAYGLILHVWQCASDPTQTACSTIDEP